MKNIQFVSFAIFILTSNMCFATITKVDDVSNGRLITIIGSEFGTKNNAAPLKFEQFEEKDGGGLPTVGNTVPTEIKYWSGRGGVAKNGIPKDMTISDAKSRHPYSFRSAKAMLGTSVENGGYSQQIWHNEIGFAKTGKVYINMWIYWKWVENPVYNDEYTYYQVKSFNVSSSHLANGDPVRPYITEFVGFMHDPPRYLRGTQSYHRNGRASHSDQPLYYDNNSVPVTMDGWVNVVLLSEPGTNDNTGLTSDGWREILISINSLNSPYQAKKEINKNYLDDETKGVHPIDSLKIGWYIGNNLKDGHMSLYYDDIYMDNTFARVEIGNNQIYKNCTHREIQIPVSWDNKKIQFTANIAAFDSSEGIYLFVFDDKNIGNTDNGYKLTALPSTTSPNIYNITQVPN